MWVSRLISGISRSDSFEGSRDVFFVERFFMSRRPSGADDPQDSAFFALRVDHGKDAAVLGVSDQDDAIGANAIRELKGVRVEKAPRRLLERNAVLLDVWPLLSPGPTGSGRDEPCSSGVLPHLVGEIAEDSLEPAVERFVQVREAATRLELPGVERGAVDDGLDLELGADPVEPTFTASKWSRTRRYFEM
jgi:hypothetical protein